MAQTPLLLFIQNNLSSSVLYKRQGLKSPPLGTTNNAKRKDPFHVDEARRRKVPDVHQQVFQRILSVYFSSSDVARTAGGIYGM